MRKFDGYLILSDLDGTLTANEVVSMKNMNAIKYFQDNGGVFTIATGRMPEYIKGYTDMFIANAPVVTINGTLVYDLKQDKIIYECPIGNDYFEPIKYSVSKYDCVSETVLYSLTETVKWSREENSDINQLGNLDGTMYYKANIVLYTENDALVLKDDLIKKFGDKFSFERSWPTGIEMHIKGSGKGECIEIIKKALNKEIHTSIGVGDYENDISLLQMADIGYATKNAIKEVKAVSDRIAPFNTEDAIAYIINKLEESVFALSDGE